MEKNCNRLCNNCRFSAWVVLIVIISVMYLGYSTYYYKSAALHYKPYAEMFFLNQEDEPLKTDDTIKSVTTPIPTPTILQTFELQGNNFQVIKSDDDPSGNGEFSFYVTAAGTGSDSDIILWNTPSARGNMDYPGALAAGSGNRLFVLDQADSAIKVYEIEKAEMSDESKPNLKYLRLKNVMIMPRAYQFWAAYQIECELNTCLVSTARSLGQGCVININPNTMKFISPAKCSNGGGHQWSENF